MSRRSRPVTKLAFDTSEGTWMNVDVSPDGKRIVFDLLGDIYIMSIDGSGASPATRLTSGPAFDMQPRFSPGRQAHRDRERSRRPVEHLDDGCATARMRSRSRARSAGSSTARPGRPTASTSTRGGTSSRSDRSAPARSGCTTRPARPTACRSPSAPAGRRTTASPTSRPTAATSITARTSRPGQTFEYNKDPNGTIYAVMRRDLVTGRERRAVSVQGGSVAPQVSPDGKTLAYIRRVRLKSALYLRDLESGRDRELFGNVDKDLQEAWAIHGLYPQYAWTPDGRSIVIWGEGKIWRVDAAIGKGHADSRSPRASSRRSTTRVRFPQKVHADEFPVRMLRDVRVSPDGKTVVYSALGQALREAAAGRPAAAADQGRSRSSSSRRSRATASGSSTRPGRDAEMGRVRVVRPDGAAAAMSSPSPGTTSSRRSRPTARRSCSGTPAAIRSAARTSPTTPGVYVVPAAGGEPRSGARRRHRSGVRSHRARGSTCARFATRSSRCFSVGVPAGDTPLPGRDEIEHVRSDNATQFAPSPDGKWIAFEERFRTFVAPFPRTGRPVDIGPATQAYPVQRVSRDAGLLPALVRRQPAALLGARSGALFARSSRTPLRSRQARGSRQPARCEASRRPRASRSASRSKSDKPSGSMALVGARVITMAGLKPGPIAGTPGVIENATILVEGNRIVAVGPSSSVQVPAGATRVDVKGKTIMPGIIDVHGAPRRRVERAARAIELAARRQPRVRRHHVARSVERHRDRLHERRADPQRRQARAAAVLDRHDPLRRGDAVQGGGRELRRCAVASAAAEGGRRVLGEELQPAAARRAADDHQGRARARDDGRARRAARCST